MRSTRATAAVARLNARSDGRHYMMSLSGTGHLILRERVDSGVNQLSEPLPLDDFLSLVNSMGPQKVARITNSEAAFLKQLEKKNSAP